MTFAIAMLGAIGLVLVFQGVSDRPPARTPRTSALDRLAVESGMPHATGRHVAVACWICAAVGSVVVFGWTGSVPVGAAVAVGAAWLPIAALRGRRERRRRRLREAWPDAIALLVAAVRSGVSLGEACMSLSRRGPLELRAGFESFTATYRATGSFGTALERMRGELADPIADRVAAALLVARDVGGTDLVGLLRSLGAFVREDLRVRREIEARWSWTVTAARVAAAAPWIVLLLMATRPEGARAYASSTGAVVIAAGAGATVIGYRLMLRAARLPQERRLGR